MRALYLWIIDQEDKMILKQVVNIISNPSLNAWKHRDPDITFISAIRGSVQDKLPFPKHMEDIK